MEQQTAADNVVAKPRPICGIWSVATPLVVLLAAVLLYVLYPHRHGYDLLVPLFIGIVAFLLSTIVGLVFSIVAFIRK